MLRSSVLDVAPAHHSFDRAEPARPAQSSPHEATVLLIDGRALVRECLAHALRSEWSAARMITSGWNALAQVADAAAVDVCIACEDGTGGMAVDRVAAAFPTAALVVLSDDQSYASIARAAGQGARGYFSTSVELRVLVQGIRLVLVGGTALPVAVATAPAAAVPAISPMVPRVLSRFSAGLFTPKELEVLRSLASGRQNKLIAHDLTICETTVKVHLRHIFRKLGTTNRTHAALLARDLLEVDPT